MTRRRAALAVVVAAVAVAVLAGVRQGSPPAAPSLSAAGLAAESARVKAGSAAVDTGRRLFVSQGCGDCHTVAASSSTGRLGPRLDVVLQQVPRTAIEGFITDPRTVRLPGYDNNLMPRDYSRRLTGGEIRALASFLHAAAG